MSTDTSGPSGSDGAADLRETVIAIEKAVALSRANNHRFLTYLLEMARLEAAGLAGKRER